MTEFHDVANRDSHDCLVKKTDFFSIKLEKNKFF
jgi:hypothetical protein